MGETTYSEEQTREAVIIRRLSVARKQHLTNKHNITTKRRSSIFITSLNVKTIDFFFITLNIKQYTQFKLVKRKQTITHIYNIKKGS